VEPDAGDVLPANRTSAAGDFSGESASPPDSARAGPERRHKPCAAPLTVPGRFPMPGPPSPARALPGTILARAALAAVLFTGLCAGTAAMPTRVAHAADNEAPATPGSVTLSGLDLHDGTIVQDGGKVYAYGTRYGCGFRWLHRSPWCGYGVSEAASLTGRWSRPKLLFSARSVIRANWKGLSGGSEVWAEIGRFFSQLRSLADPT